ncbi:MAG: hypothetical protein ACRDTD_19610, partial [Pseudonocardiaceae bacterium]
ATVDQLLERYLDQFDGAPSTLRMYRGYMRSHISPYLGRIKVGTLDADTLDAFYAEPSRSSTTQHGASWSGWSLPRTTPPRTTPPRTRDRPASAER